MKLAITLTAVLALALHVGQSLANDPCQFIDGKREIVLTANIPAELKVQRDTPVGTVIYDQTLSSGAQTTAINCYRSFSFAYGYPKLFASDAVSGMEDVYKTSNPGIGVRGWSSNTSPTDLKVLRPTEQDNEWVDAGKFYPSANYRLQLVVIGKVDNTPLNLMNHHATYWYHNLLATKVVFGNTDIIVTTQSCEVSNNAKNLNVTLGRVEKSSFKEVGSISGKTAFAITLNCAEGTNVNMTFDGVLKDNNDSILELDDSAQENTAKGVGVQIAYQDTPLQLNKSTPLAQNVPEGPKTFPFEAHYIKTGDISSGIANATATFTLTYR